MYEVVRASQSRWRSASRHAFSQPIIGLLVETQLFSSRTRRAGHVHFNGATFGSLRTPARHGRSRHRIVSEPPVVAGEPLESPLAAPSQRCRWLPRFQVLPEPERVDVRRFRVMCVSWPRSVYKNLRKNIYSVSTTPRAAHFRDGDPRCGRSGRCWRLRGSGVAHRRSLRCAGRAPQWHAGL